MIGVRVDISRTFKKLLNNKETNMQESVKITVNLSRMDIKYFIFGEYYNRIKITLIVYIALDLLIFAFVIPGLLSLIYWLQLAAVFLVLFILFLAFNLLPALIRYLRLISSMSKQNSFSQTNWYEFSKYMIMVTSQTESQTYYWNYLFKIDEYRAGFTIFLSPNQSVIIPKRCFTSQEQLDLFYFLITSNVSRSKLDLKKRKSYKLSPADADVIAPLEIKPPSVFAEVPLAEISFKLTNSEFITYYYRRMYTSPGGIFVVLLALTFLIYGLTRYDTIHLIVWVGVGILLLLAFPISLYTRTIKPSINDPNVMKKVTYRFTSDHMITDGFYDEILQIRWTDIYKIQETKSSYIIYCNKRITHLIPKRAFDDKPEQLDIFLSLLGKVPGHK